MIKKKQLQDDLQFLYCFIQEAIKVYNLDTEHGSLYNKIMRDIKERYDLKDEY